MYGKKRSGSRTSRKGIGSRGGRSSRSSRAARHGDTRQLDVEHPGGGWLEGEILSRSEALGRFSETDVAHRWIVKLPNAAILFYVENLSAQEEGRGVGGRTLEEGMRRARDLGATHAFLFPIGQKGRFADLVRFYRSHGFTMSRMKRGVWEVGPGEYETMPPLMYRAL